MPFELGIQVEVEVVQHVNVKFRVNSHC